MQLYSKFGQIRSSHLEKNISCPPSKEGVQQQQVHTRVDLNYYLNEVIDPDRQEEVFDYFRSAETDSLEKAHEELGENEYTIDEIRLMRIRFMSELGN